MNTDSGHESDEAGPLPNPPPWPRGRETCSTSCQWMGAGTNTSNQLNQTVSRSVFTGSGFGLSAAPE